MCALYTFHPIFVFGIVNWKPFPQFTFIQHSLNKWMFKTCFNFFNHTIINIAYIQVKKRTFEFFRSHLMWMIFHLLFAYIVVPYFFKNFKSHNYAFILIYDNLCSQPRNATFYVSKKCPNNRFWALFWFNIILFTLSGLKVFFAFYGCLYLRKLLHCDILKNQFAALMILFLNIF